MIGAEFHHCEEGLFHNGQVVLDDLNWFVDEKPKTI